MECSLSELCLQRRYIMAELNGQKKASHHVFRAGLFLRHSKPHWILKIILVNNIKVNSVYPGGLWRPPWNCITRTYIGSSLRMCSLYYISSVECHFRLVVFRARCCCFLACCCCPDTTENFVDFWEFVGAKSGTD